MKLYLSKKDRHMINDTCRTSDEKNLKQYKNKIRRKTKWLK